MRTSIDCLSGVEPDIGHDLEQQAREVLGQHSHFRGRTNHFQYECDTDVLTVRGIVPTFYLKQLLQSALKGLKVRVENQVVVAGYMNAIAIEMKQVSD